MRVTLDARGTADAIRARMSRRATAVQDAARRTVNILAMKGTRGIQDEMRRVFDRPTPYAINSVAWVENLPGPAAAVVFRGSTDPVSRAGQFKGAHEAADQGYLKAQIYGGVRRQKASEIRLQRLRIVNQQIYVVPTKYADLDAFGNISRGQIIKILSALEALGGPGQGFDSNRKPGRKGRGRRRAEEYFAVWPGTNGQLPPAIYRRYGRGASAFVRPVLIFAKKAATYRPRLDPTGVVRGVIDREAATVWAERVAKALQGAS